jgi:hypothetical protein
MIMTLRNVTRQIRLALFGALIASLSGTVWANETAGRQPPGFDRVGKTLVGGMRGQQEAVVPESVHARSTGEGRAAARAMVKRKNELTKRMFWIMMSMR